GHALAAQASSPPARRVLRRDEPARRRAPLGDGEGRDRPARARDQSPALLADAAGRPGADTADAREPLAAHPRSREPPERLSGSVVASLFVVGGARSGKSRYAVDRSPAAGRLAFLATADE